MRTEEVEFNSIRGSILGGRRVDIKILGATSSA